jgi:vancomycin resistance protein YoaR
MVLLRSFIVLLLIGGIVAAIRPPHQEAVMGSYVTSLQGRTRGQRNNARLAAERLEGAVIRSGETFSFNRRVGPWTPDRGYVTALVSYDGELVTDWGGGVCQTSTTLYNAALLAGLQVVERHRHTFAPKYVPPGRDAAVAQREIDLKLKNLYPWPVRIHTRATDGSIGFEILGAEPGPMAEVESVSQRTVPAVEVIRPSRRLAAGQRRVINRGHSGVRVSVFRRPLLGKKQEGRELISQDSYPPMDRVVAVGNAGDREVRK